MIKLQTPVEIQESSIKIGFGDGILLLGSCFSDNIGSIMKDMGFNVMVNPFGTLYNPVSVCNSIRRLDSAVPFSEDECVQMVLARSFSVPSATIPQRRGARRRSLSMMQMLRCQRLRSFSRRRPPSSSHWAPPGLSVSMLPGRS